MEFAGLQKRDIMTADFYSEIKANSGAYKFYVNGEWKESKSGKVVPILNPSTNQTAFEVQGRCVQPRCIALDSTYIL